MEGLHVKREALLFSENENFVICDYKSAKCTKFCQKMCLINIEG